VLTKAVRDGRLKVEILKEEDWRLLGNGQVAAPRHLEASV